MTLRPSVCIDAVLEEWPLDEALALVAKLGYSAFEFWMWWEKDLDALLALRDRHRLAIAACCTKFVSLVDPSQRKDYLEGLEQSIAAAQRLGCPTLISQVGDARSGVSRDEQQDCMVEGLVQAAGLLQGTGITLAIEPLNDQIDHVGYYLVHSKEAFEIMERVQRPEIKVTFDLYHQQISEGNLIRNLTANISKIAHFHGAGNPGRHELGIGEIHYPNVIRAIADTGFDGYLGLEYWPQRAAAEGLAEALAWVQSD